MLTRAPRASPLLAVIICLSLAFSYFKRYDLRLTSSPSECKLDQPQNEQIKKSELDFHVPIQFYPGRARAPGWRYNMTLVIPKMSNDDVSWTAELDGIGVVLYEVDRAFAKYTVPMNKGKEAMAYLTYLIDHYDSLPEIILFFHAHSHAWHNNDIMGQSSLETIRRLQPDRVARLGYMNTRCQHDPGCPDHIHLDRPAIDLDYIGRGEEIFIRPSLWRELHPGAAHVPPSLAQPCCAQFAVSRERVRQVPKRRFEHYRQWLLDTSLGDEISGRVFEYMWQYIFTGNPQYCPPANSCFCDGYGICFGGARNYESYLGKAKEVREIGKKREELERKLVDRSERPDKEEAERMEREMTHLGDEILRLEEEQQKMRDEAFERGTNERARQMERESYDDELLFKYLHENPPPESFGFAMS